MKLDQDACYRAVRARDARFDGRFFTAVRTTGIYCRPICPATTPKRQHCAFFSSAAAAQAAGFRPCLRCRPEAAPDSPAWLGSARTVSRALSLISQGALDDGDVDGLASRVGIGERQLRRLFARHAGVTPGAVGQARRVSFAKKLIDETDLPMSVVAHGAGFSSIRRFNHEVRKIYGSAPRELRRGRKRDVTPSDPTNITLRLAFRPPYHWEGLVRFLSARAIPGVEQVDGDAYRRTIRAHGQHAVVEVRRARPGRHWLLARIHLRDAKQLRCIAQGLRSLFDLDADPAEVDGHLCRDPRVGPLVRRSPGMRVPGAWDGFELAVRAILGQQVSVKGATTLAGRLAERFGEALALGDGGSHGNRRVLFPRPAVLARARLTQLGLPRARQEAIRSLARAVENDEVDLDSSRDVAETVAVLTGLPGIGEWTAQYIAMRALREPDALPATDLGLQRALRSTTGRADRSSLLKIAEPWRPWRAYAAMHLWAAGSGDGGRDGGHACR